MNVSLIVNPIAGNRAYRSIKQLETFLNQKASLTSCITQKRGDAFNFAKNLKGADRIIIASGDGTINEVLNGMLASSDPDVRKIPVALIPLGTTNVLAKDLNIPGNVEKALDLALNGNAGSISLGRINGRYFSLMAGIGLDAEAVMGVRNGLIKKISGKAAHIISGLRVLKSYDPPLIRVKTPEGEMSGHTVIVGNAKNYAGYFYITPEASITEPVLDICVLRGNKRKDLLRFISEAIQKKHLEDGNVSYSKAEEMEIASEGEVHVQIDGDYFGTLPVKIDVVKDAVSMVW